MIEADKGVSRCQCQVVTKDEASCKGKAQALVAQKSAQYGLGAVLGCAYWIY